MRRVRWILGLLVMVAVCFVGVVIVFPSAGDPIGFDLGHELRPTTTRFTESLVVLGFGVAMGFFGWVLWRSIRDYWLMNLRGITVPGTVRTLDIRGGSSEDPREYHTQVDLTRADGRPITLRVRGTSLDRLSVGRAVRVRYDPKGRLPPRFATWRVSTVIGGLFFGGFLHYLFVGTVVTSVGLVVAGVVHLFTGS